MQEPYEHWYTEEEAPQLFTEAGKLLLVRINLISHEEMKKWAVRMIREWSRNEETSQIIVDYAMLRSELLDLEAEAAKAEYFIETGNGSLKRHPVVGMIEKHREKVLAFSRKLNIDSETPFYGENYE